MEEQNRPGTQLVEFRIMGNLVIKKALGKLGKLDKLMKTVSCRCPAMPSQNRAIWARLFCKPQRPKTPTLRAALWNNGKPPLAHGRKATAV